MSDKDKSNEKDKEEEAPEAEEGQEAQAQEEGSPTSSQEPPEAPEVGAQEAPAAGTVTPHITPAPVAQPSNNPVSPDSSAAATTPQAPASPQQMSPQDEALFNTANHMAFGQDLAQGKVAPQTYQSLYDKKDTLGKIGTLFGLMVSGAGSGLAHQSNAVLDMMNKEIERDLDAQKQNAANKQNWYRMAMEHEKMKAEIPLTQSMTLGNLAKVAETYSNVYGKNTENISKALENDIKKWQAGQLGVKNMENYNNALSYSLLGRDQTLQNTVNGMPDGPGKAASQGILDNVVKPDTTKRILQNNQQTSAKKALANAANPDPIQKALNKGALNDNDVIDTKKFNSLVNQGRAAENLHIGAPLGAIPAGQVPVINQEIKELKLNRNNASDYDRNFKAMDALSNAGQVPAASALAHIFPAVGGALGTLTGGLLGGLGGSQAGSLAQSGAHEGQKFFERDRDILKESLKQRIGKNMSENEKNDLIESMLPKWSDSPEQREQAYQIGVQHFRNLEAPSNLNQYGLAREFPNYQFQTALNKPKEKPSKKDNGQNAATGFLDRVKSVLPGAFGYE